MKCSIRVSEQLRKAFAFALVFLPAACALAASVTNVRLSQDWPWSTKVCVDYDLVDDAGAVHDVSVTFADGGKTYTPAIGSLSGDVYAVAPGVNRRLVWEPLAGEEAEPFTIAPSLKATVTIEDQEKAYMIVDISGGKDADHEVSFMSAPPSGGWNQDEYKKSKLVLRRIPAGTFWMGMTPDELAKIPAADNDMISYNGNNKQSLTVRRRVTLTKPYYIGIFPVTLRQHTYLNGTSSAIDSYISSYGETAPLKACKYKTVRGANASAAANWPNADAESVVGRLNAHAAVPLDGYKFELPSHAQWVNACRGGTASTYNSGRGFADDMTPSRDANLGELGWYKDNYAAGGSDSIHPVGLKLPNNLGLYDMHGNVLEYVRDIYSTAENYTSLTRVDPLVRGGNAYVRIWAIGGGAYSKVGHCMVESLCNIDVLAESTTYYSSAEFHYCGYRLACVYEPSAPVPFVPADQASGTSPSATVWGDATDSLLWRTVRSFPLTVGVTWPKGAAKATVTAAAGGEPLATQTLTDRTVTSCTLSFAQPTADADERAVDLTLSFADGSDAVLESKTARVGIVRGVNGAAFRLLPAGPSAARWGRTKASRPVLPVYADTSAVTDDGEELALDGKPGWVETKSLDTTAREVSMTGGSGVCTRFLQALGGLLLLFK